MPKTKPRYDGEHLFKTLAAEIKRHPKYTSPDDDLETTGGLIQAAILVIGRMADDLNAQKRMMNAGQFRD